MSDTPKKIEVTENSPVLTDGEGIEVAVLSSKYNGVCEEIAHRYNSHDARVEALEYVESLMSVTFDHMTDAEILQEFGELGKANVRQVRAALLAAKGGE